MPLRVLVADDHRLFAELLAGMLKNLDADAVVETVASYAGAVAAIDGGRHFDLILLDLNMPGMLGLTGLEKIVAKCPSVPVALVSGTARHSDLRGALKAGARGVLPKSLSADEFKRAITAIRGGDIYAPAALVPGSVLEGPDTTGGRGQLTPREREVFEALVGGRSNAEIGQLLGISEVTVKIHLQNVYRKIAAKNRSDAVRIGLVEASVHAGA